MDMLGKAGSRNASGVAGPTGTAPLRIGIVGGGASGTLLAALLLRRASAPIDITVFDPTAELARGIAYGTDDPLHLLNVPARNMSAFVDDPDHFRAWAGCNDADFVSRRRYGEYLHGILHNAESSAAPGGALTHVRDSVVAVQPSDKPRVVTEGGLSLAFDRVVLATGHGAPEVPQAFTDLDGAALITDPWAANALASINPGDEVLVVGTGLTFVDVALSLARRTPTARVHAISRHGLAPQSHETPLRPAPPAPDALLENVNPVEVLRYVRSFGDDWRQGIDSLRAITPALWLAMSERHRHAFMDHLSRYWNAHRHRMPAEAAQRLLEAIVAGGITIHQAAAVSAANRDGRLRVQLSSGDALTVDRVIMCTGPSADIRRSDLGRQMVGEGVARSGPFDLGFDCDPKSGALLDSNGRLHEAILTLGPPRTGVLWESTAMPEIRIQVDQMCTALLHSAISGDALPRR